MSPLTCMTAKNVDTIIKGLITVEDLDSGTNNLVLIFIPFSMVLALIMVAGELKCILP